MNRLRQTLTDVAGLLESRDWALIGGLAVSARAEPRFTRDLDLAVAVPSDAHAETLIREFLAAGYGVLATVEQDAVSRLATARLEPPGEPSGGVVVDLLFASSGIEPELVRAADLIELFQGTFVPVATTGHLMALKVLSRDDRNRPQDIADLRALLNVATADDIALTRAALALVAERGFARQRDVVNEFGRLLV